jgi:hypothetical protein
MTEAFSPFGMPLHPADAAAEQGRRVQNVRENLVFVQQRRYRAGQPVMQAGEKGSRVRRKKRPGTTRTKRTRESGLCAATPLSGGGNQSCRLARKVREPGAKKDQGRRVQNVRENLAFVQQRRYRAGATIHAGWRERFESQAQKKTRDDAYKTYARIWSLCSNAAIGPLSPA